MRKRRCSWAGQAAVKVPLTGGRAAAAAPPPAGGRKPVDKGEDITSGSLLC